jgi:tRNA A37 threonylcarbamoyladenosine dehydratase
LNTLLQRKESITHNCKQTHTTGKWYHVILGYIQKKNKLYCKKKKVIIFGLGGVGGYEAILFFFFFSRMGIGHLTGVDPDVFEISNINRQMLATSRVIGKKQKRKWQKKW